MGKHKQLKRWYPNGTDRSPCQFFQRHLHPPQSISRKVANKPLPRKSDPGPYPLPTSQGFIHYPHPRALSITHIPFWRPLSLRGCFPPKSKQIAPEPREFHSHQDKTGLCGTSTSLRPATPFKMGSQQPSPTEAKSAINAQTGRHSEILGHSLSFNASPTNSNGEMTPPGKDLTILYHRIPRHP